MKNFDNRRFILLLIISVVAVLFILRLMTMQLMTDKWKARAAKISEWKVFTYAPRGVIYDRNGNKLVENKTFYDLMVKPVEVDKNMDKAAFSKLLGITEEEFEKRLEKAKNYSFYIPSQFEKEITSEDYGRISEELPKYPGFYPTERTMRGYRKEAGAHVLGYIAEVSGDEIKNDPYYKERDYIGKIGIEKYYEKILRGQRGVRMILKDAVGMESKPVEGGKYDTMAVQGEGIYTSIDAELQAYGEKLMQNKKGSIVCIEPETGEILALVSAPSYSPSLLTGREYGKNYMSLQKDSLKPLPNRAITGLYPPGSIFKMAQALIGLQEGVINLNTGFPCDKSLVGCHNHPTAVNLTLAVQYSCNPYFYRATQRIIQQNKVRSFFKDSEIGLKKWTEYMHSFGFGVKLETDISGILKGFIPDVEYYNKIHGEGRWAFSTIYSISIGQGEVLVIPLQMANFAAIMANRGYYVTPHFVRGIGEPGKNIPEQFTRKNKTMVDAHHFEPLVEAMRAAVNDPGGTGSRAKVPGITVCGKTGTAQNPHGEDHAVFICFAPMEKPKIAVSVYVENAGFGGVWSAPIASLMMEKYLTGTVTDTLKEKTILDAVILDVKKEKATTNAKSRKRLGNQ